MAHSVRRETYRTAAYSIHVLGAPTSGPRDLYHALLRVPWWATLLVIVAGYLALNGLFALFFLLSGGIANARAGSLLDAFFFSVQTMGTIGYGSMYPTTAVAHWLVVGESVTSLVFTALATGLVFVRFSQVRSRLVFSSCAAIGPIDGVPTLMVRVGNERRGGIVDTQFRLSFTRTTVTAEGVTIYRIQELPLVRSRAPVLSRSWNVMHQLLPGTALYGLDAAALAASDFELLLEVIGVDEVSLQPVHARHTWFTGSLIFGARLADVISETPEGDMVLDLRQFHEVVKLV